MSGLVTLQETSIPQTTIAQVRSIDGKAAFADGVGKLVFLPADPDAGIVFRVGQAIVPLDPARLVENAKQHTTGLRISDSVQMLTVEHLLAAVRGLGISNLQIATTSNALIPFLDGSALGFTDILTRAIIEEQAGHLQKRVVVEKSFTVHLDQSFVRLDPDPGLVISAAIEFQDPIGIQLVRYWQTPTMFCLHLAWARTFAFNEYKDEATTRKRLPGFEITSGAQITESNMIVFRDGKHITHLRSPDEHVRHKILDMLGDLAWLPAPLQGSLSVFRPSHALNRKLVRVIHEEISKA